jgi:hypothetical protein
VLARLFDDMAPFHFQIEAAWHHSVWGRHRIRHPPHAGCTARKARLRGPAPHSDCLENQLDRTLPRKQQLVASTAATRRGR